MDMTLNESIDSLSKVAVNEYDESCTEPEELGSTRELRVVDKIEVYWPLDVQFYPGSVSEYAGPTENIE